VGNDKEAINAAFFKETSLTNIARMLIPGDNIRLCGIFKYWNDYGTTIHVEKLTIRRAADIIIKRNPKCPKCGARMKSAGKNKGWKCPKCGFRSLSLKHEVIVISRKYLEGHYIPKDSAIKHLIKPRRRYGRERNCTLTPPQGSWIK